MICCGTKKASPETQMCVCVCVCVCVVFTLKHSYGNLWQSISPALPALVLLAFFTADNSLCSQSVPAMAIRISITRYSMRIQKRRMEISLSALLRDCREKQTHAYMDR